MHNDQAPCPSITHSSMFLRLRQDGPAREVAWRDFHQRYTPIIRAFALRMGAKQHDVDDVVQDVLLGFFSASPEFVYDPAQGRFRGYLKTCVWRKLQKCIGREIRLGGRPLDQIDPQDLQVETPWIDIWEQEKLQRALAIVRDRYASRSDKARTFLAFEMNVILERPASDVASELGISADSVHAAKARISKALRDVMFELDATTG